MFSTTNSSFSYVDSHVIEDFGKTGVESLTQILHGQDESEQDNDNSSQIFTEVLLAYDSKKISLEDLLKFLSVSIKDEEMAVAFSQILDVFPLSDSIQRLLVELFRNQKIIKPSTFAKVISYETLVKSSIVPADTLTRQMNISKRDEFYTQRKFNLIVEEMEGYTKLTVEMYNIMRSEETEFQVTYALNIVEELIGHYSLDPNRVLDILFDVFSNNLVAGYKFVLAFLRKSRWWPAEESDCFTSIEALHKGGNETAAKLMGLRLLKQPADKDLPETLKILFALLIKEGFISFGSVYQYIGPPDSEMQSLEDEFKKEMDEKVFKSSASALALAAPLKDDEAEDNSTGEEKESNVTNTVDHDSISKPKSLQHIQKYQFLKVFLGNGLYYPSIYILTEFPYLSYLDDEISELINRIFDRMLSPLYNVISPFSTEDVEKLHQSRKIAYSRSFNNIRYEEYPCVELLSFKPTLKSHSQKKFTYFYEDWGEGLPLIHNIDDLFVLSQEFLKFNGVNIAKNLELFVKISEIGYWDLSNNENDPARKNAWLNYFRNFIFPAMTTIEENPLAIEMAYRVMNFYDKEDRYNIIGEMHQVSSKNNPFIKISYGKAEKSTKDILKRLSKENIPQMMRRIAKISFANPLPCLLTILQQIESYDNLINLVVETARYFNTYCWDALLLAILLRLTASGRSSMQVDGLNDRQWVLSLSTFIGKICQRYPNSVDLETLLLFLLKSFYNKDGIAVVVLRELFASMGGIQGLSNLTLNQVDMINCGFSLEKIVYRTINDLRYERQKSGRILFESLIKLDAINELLILLNHLCEDVIYRSDYPHLKLLSTKNDDLITVMHLFLMTINFFGDREDMSELLLPVPELVNTYGVLPQWAFELWKPILRRKLFEGGVSKEDLLSRFNDLKEGFSGILNKDIWSFLSKDLYITFWLLSLYDINYTSGLYEGERAKLESSIGSIKETIKLNKNKTELNKLTLERYKEILYQNEGFIKDIPLEVEIHSEHYESVMSILKQESANWFALSGDSETLKQNQYFLQYCLLPRAIHSPFDASFAAKFFFLLHKLGVSNFSLYTTLNELINSGFLFGTIFTLTPMEVENFGMFFAEVMRALFEWKREETYAKNSFPLGNSHSMDLRDFCNMLYGYSLSVLDNLTNALECEEYMCRRNAITFLKCVISIYPAVTEHGEKIMSLLEKLFTSDDREDIKLASNALMGHVKAKSKDWVPLYDFVYMTDEEKGAYLEQRNKLMEERKQTEEKMKKEEEQLRLKAKIESANSSLEKGKLKSLSYDDSENRGQRTNIRGFEASKGRYDNYSRYEEKKEETPKETQEARQNLKLDRENYSEENSREGNGEPLDKGESKNLLFKNKLKEARKELQASRGRTDEQSSPSPVADTKTPQPELTKDVMEDSPSEDTRTSKDTEVKKRTPLPPQQFGGRSDVSENLRSSNERYRGDTRPYNENYNGYRYQQRQFSSKQTGKLQYRPASAQQGQPGGRNYSRSPVPPPPLPPTDSPRTGAKFTSADSRLKSTRFDNKRKQDYHSTERGYDKRPRY